jgi:hypothetical protein
MARARRVMGATKATVSAGVRGSEEMEIGEGAACQGRSQQVVVSAEVAVSAHARRGKEGELQSCSVAGWNATAH